MLARTKILYWVFTLLFVVPFIASGLGMSAAAPPAVEGIIHLGFPFYLIRFLGVAKLLGALAILNERFPRLKEWAYAGFTFDLAGAFYSHLSSGDGPRALPPVVILVFTLLSYRYWNKLASLRIAMGSFDESHELKTERRGSQGQGNTVANSDSALSV